MPTDRVVRRVVRRPLLQACSHWLESLESRRMLANLAVTSVKLTNGSGVVLNPVPMGAFVSVEVGFDISNLPAGSTYRIRTTVNGQSLDGPVLDWGAGGGSGPAGYRWGQHYVNTTAGSVIVQATLDVFGSVVETNEADNTMSASIPTMTFAPKFSAPIGGTQGVDWTIVNYVDVDRNTTGVKDYLGGPWAYDGHDALDITLANFRKQDQGVPIYAAAPGTVLEVNDGDFDRNTPDASQPGANYVIIDHGGGWVGYYWHARLNSVAVAAGQTVARGQTIAMVGSSGFSSDSHLHVGFYYKDALVETYAAPNAYWTSPYAYSGDLRSVIDADMIEASATITGPEFRERPPVQRVFKRGERARTWAHISGLQPGEVVRFRYIGPDNGVYLDASYGTSDIYRYGWYTGSTVLPANAPLGQYRALVDIAGVNKWDIPFTVTAGGAPNLQLSQGSAYVIDGRLTPIDFGSLNQSSASGGSLPFTIRNRGVAPLSVTSLQLPQGFVLDGTLPSSIAPNSSTTITIKLDRRFGNVSAGNAVLTTDDPDQPTTTFAVKGTVVDDRAPSFVDGYFDVNANKPVVNFDEFIDFGYFYDPDVTLRRITDNLNIPIEPAYPDADRSVQRFNPFMHPTGLPDGNYRLTLPVDTIGDLSSTFATAPATLDFFVLAGDATRDRTVNFDDLLLLAANYNQSGKLFTQGDFNNDGTVNFDDLLMLAARYNTTLPAASPAASVAPTGLVSASPPAPAEDDLPRVTDGILA